MENPFQVGEIVTLVTRGEYEPFQFLPVTKITKTTVTLSNGKTYLARNGDERGTGLRWPEKIVKKTPRHEEANREQEERRLIQKLRREVGEKIQKLHDLKKLQQITAILEDQSVE